MLWTVISTLVGIWVVGLCFWIIMDRRPPASTLAWILVLTFLPVVGIPVYLFLGPRRWDKKKAHLKQAKAYVEEHLSDFLPPVEAPGLDERSAQIVAAIRRSCLIPLSRASHEQRGVFKTRCSSRCQNC